MINLEWFRSFRTVYITQSVSKAAEELNISQPTVSQHLASLEAFLGKQLFVRKSKGVMATSDGRQLNNLISGPIEALEIAELSLTQKDGVLHSIQSIGISEHMYKSVLRNIFNQFDCRIHIRFGEKEQLIKEVERGNLLYAVVPGTPDGFDLINTRTNQQDLVLVGTPDIDFATFERHYEENQEEAENWLYQHKWFAHDNNNNFIKSYWLYLFNKKRPTLIADFVIPNEHEILYQLSMSSGLTVALDTSVKPFLQSGVLKTCSIKKKQIRQLSLIGNKKKANTAVFEKLSQLIIENCKPV